VNLRRNSAGEEIMDTKEFCVLCQRDIVAEHDAAAHKGSTQYAVELAAWKESLRKTSEHHKSA
jgi:hypothetical protein